MTRFAILRFLPIAALTVLGTTGAHAQTEREVQRLDGSRITPGRIDSTVRREMQAGRVAGLAVAILNEGQVVYLKSFGFRDVAKQERLTDTTVMYGASFTKSVFAYVVMQLVHEKAFDLDKPVHEYLGKPLPEFANYRDLGRDDRWRRITGRMLLSHTAGFPNWRWFNADTLLDIKFDPGTRYAYSGEGISLLQFVVEHVTGRSAGDLIQERVFDRFGMTRTGMVWRPAFEGNYAVGHDEEGRSLGYRKRSSARAAGSMATTVRDYARFVRAVVQGEGLSPAARSEMLGPQVRIHSKYQFPTTSTEVTVENDSIRLSYGLGWGLFWSRYGKAYFKEGHDDGWENHSVCFEDSGTCLVLMANSSNGDGIFKTLLAELIGDTATPWVWEGYTPYPAPPRTPEPWYLSLRGGGAPEATSLPRSKRAAALARLTRRR